MIRQRIMVRGWCRAAVLCSTVTTAAWGAGCVGHVVSDSAPGSTLTTDTFQIDHHPHNIDVVKARSNTANYNLMYGPYDISLPSVPDHRSHLGLNVDGYNGVRQGYVYYASQNVDDTSTDPAEQRQQEARAARVIYHPRVLARLTRSSSPRTRLVVRIVSPVDGNDTVVEQIFHLCEQGDNENIQVELFSDAANMSNNNPEIDETFVAPGHYAEVKSVSNGSGGFTYTFSVRNQPIPWTNQGILMFLRHVRDTARSVNMPWTPCNNEPTDTGGEDGGGTRGGH